MTAASVACPAKVNLFLTILAREDSGHHQIETAFQAVGLFDRVDVRAADRSGTHFRIERREPEPGAGDLVGDLGDPASNTVVQAAEAFFAATGIAPRVSITLVKTIPAGTGMGGGSSDAAGALAALNALHGGPLAQADLIALGGSIGADVPFFCARTPIALGWGRGDRLLPLPPRSTAHVVLAIPHDRVSTAAAYRDASAALTLPARPCVLDELRNGGWDALAALQHNDFERSVFGRAPALAAVRRALERAGAMIARLTGSGAAVVGVFNLEDDARRAAGVVRTMDGVAAALVVPTLEAAPLPESR